MSAELRKVIITDYDMITPYGLGVENCWNGLLNGVSAITALDRIETENFIACNGAVVPGLDYNTEVSLIEQMLSKMFNNRKPNIDKDYAFFLATTTGEIDLLEQDVFLGNNNSERSNLKRLLGKTERMLGVEESKGILVSAACASATVAIARASMMIVSGEIDSAVVVACDCLSEFVFSGFSALMAMSSDIARPFDKDRSGLSLGEAAGYIVLMNEEKAKYSSADRLGEIAGWGLSGDAYHMTGPNPDGSGLLEAINSALHKANVNSSDIKSISAHGTGTLYNDSMELEAFKSVFKERVLPAYSIKGGTGHTLGAAGLIETILALRSMQENIILPTIGFNNIPEGYENEWISPEKRIVKQNDYVLKVNSGFGGINAALVLKRA